METQTPRLRCLRTLTAMASDGQITLSWNSRARCNLRTVLLDRNRVHPRKWYENIAGNLPICLIWGSRTKLTYYYLLTAV